MSERTAELKKRNRLSSNSKPVSILSKLSKVVRGERIVGEREREKGSEEGIESLDFGGERELRSKGKVGNKTVTKFGVGGIEGVTIRDPWAQEEAEVFL